MSKFIIYGLIDPRSGELRYVGKSTSGLKRPRCHFAEWHLAKDKTYKGNWIRGLLAEGLKPEILILEEYDSPEELSEAECWNIAYYKSIGCRLTNMTLGGDGSTGRRHSMSTRKKMSAKHTGKRMSAVARRRMSEAKRGKPQRIEVVEARTKKIRGRKCSPEEIARRAKAISKPIVDHLGRRYSSIKEAASVLGLQASNITKVLKGKRPHTGGFGFYYVSENNNDSPEAHAGV